MRAVMRALASAPAPMDKTEDRPVRWYTDCVRGPVAWFAVIWSLIVGPVLADKPAIAADTAAVPTGHWDGDYADKPRICLDVLAKHRLRLTFDDSHYRRAVVVEGPYQVLERSEKGAELQLTVDRVVTKELGRCRNTWVRTELPTYHIASLVLSVGRTLALKIDLGCTVRVSTARLCLRKDGKDLLCRQLRSERGANCRPEPPYSLDQILPMEKPREDPDTHFSDTPKL